MMGLKERRGLILFFLIAAILLAAAILAFQATGPQGIEERFHSAAGLSPEEEEHAGHGEEGGAALAIEGNPLLYGILLCCLVIGCAALYYHYRI
ncbi:hypothetical protein [Methanoregula sp.]|uniref:hypothetical protein n=1 Tax=Methanoregula sp. TaxID=2052170 RepID=UPI000CAF8C54|nr:hypothetical protein [Methanoregula sp.]PKG33429.1 MAG: hypothetical protein CW742_03025 [Methanoregula sp.]